MAYALNFIPISDLIFMDNKNAVIVIAIVAVMAVMAVAAVTVMNNDKVSGEDTYTLYVGLNDSVTHEDYDPDYAAGIVDAIVVKYADGFTRYLANGGWVDDGDIGYEKSLVYVITGIDADKAHKIADDAKAALNQKSIMITISKQNVEFY